VARGLLRGGVHRDAAKDALLVHLLAGTPLAAVEAAAAHFVDVLLQDRLRPDTLARLRWHRAEGHDVVIVSASPAVYLSRLGERLEVQAVLATELEVGEDGRLTGRMRGRNCRGPEKVARLDGWLADRPHPRPDRLYAYGDSAGDRELLARADVGVRVGGRPIPPASPQ
jgi:phosphatidylglycerophosphatase C